jgi:hypothetical protein
VERLVQPLLGGGEDTNNVSLNFTMAKKLKLLATFADVLKPTVSIVWQFSYLATPTPAQTLKVAPTDLSKFLSEFFKLF